jgi:hypothetical protein
MVRRKLSLCSAPGEGSRLLDVVLEAPAGAGDTVWAKVGERRAIYARRQSFLIENWGETSITLGVKGEYAKGWPEYAR